MLAVPPSLTREGWGISLSAESDDIICHLQIEDNRLDVDHFTTSLPLSWEQRSLSELSKFAYGKYWVAFVANTMFAANDGRVVFYTNKLF